MQPVVKFLTHRPAAIDTIITGSIEARTHKSTKSTALSFELHLLYELLHNTTQERSLLLLLLLLSVRFYKQTVEELQQCWRYPPAGATAPRKLAKTLSWKYGKHCDRHSGRQLHHASEGGLGGVGS